MGDSVSWVDPLLTETILKHLGDQNNYIPPCNAVLFQNSNSFRKSGGL